MAKDKNKPTRKRTTTKQVQSTENDPPRKPIPDVPVTPERDEDPYDGDGLTFRQRRFVDALVGPAGGNATKAARMAGYRDDNNVALRAMAYENLTKPHVQRAISHAYALQRMSPEWAKASLVDLASSSMANFLTLDDKGEVALDFEKAAAAGAFGQIKEYKEEGIKVGDSPVQVIKRTIKLHDRNGALANLLKLHGLLIERRDITTDGKAVKGYADIDDGDDANPDAD